jgi:1,4-dihydroxy-2-naphthoate octaprenyltransferase
MDKGPDEMQKPGPFLLWFLAIRPQTLPASLSPVAVGAALAFADGHTNVRDALTFWVFALFIQIGTNLHNDYADFVKGADTKERLGQARVTQKGWMTPTEVATGATLALTSAAAVGVRLVAVGGRPMVFVVATSLFNAVAYTGGPYPLGYIHPRLGDFSIGYLGLGDLFVLLYFGFVAVCGTYYLCSSPQLVLPAHVVWAATPTGFLATAIIVVNNLRDRKTDVKAGKRTLAVRFGETFARIEYTLLVAGSYVMLLAGAALGKSPLHSPFWLLPWLSMPVGLARVSKIWALDGKALNPLLGATAQFQLLFCALFCAAIVLAREPPLGTSTLTLGHYYSRFRQGA